MPTRGVRQGDEALDGLERHCPRLGGSVPFRYCRSCDRDREPCFKVLDCWWERFDVVTFFKDRMSSEAFQRLAAARPPDKVVTLVDLIRQAQDRLR